MKKFGSFVTIMVLHDSLQAKNTLHEQAKFSDAQGGGSLGPKVWTS